jgi:hypothetical protein
MSADLHARANHVYAFVGAQHAAPKFEEIRK